MKRFTTCITIMLTVVSYSQKYIFSFQELKVDRSVFGIHLDRNLLLKVPIHVLTDDINFICEVCDINFGTISEIKEYIWSLLLYNVLVTGIC